MQVSGNNRYPTSVQEQNSQTKARKQNIIRKLDIGGRTLEVVETILTDECIETDFLELENKHLRVNHTEVGSKLAIKWCFPESLVDTILHHHYPENGTQNPKLTHMLYCRFSHGEIPCRP